MTDQQISDTATLEPGGPTDADASGADALDQAIAIIDEALAKMMQRELVSSGEVADLLLDLRTLLTSGR